MSPAKTMSVGLAPGTRTKRNTIAPISTWLSRSILSSCVHHDRSLSVQLTRYPFGRSTGFLTFAPPSPPFLAFAGNAVIRSRHGDPFYIVNIRAEHFEDTLWLLLSENKANRCYLLSREMCSLSKLTVHRCTREATLFPRLFLLIGTRSPDWTRYDHKNQ